MLSSPCWLRGAPRTMPSYSVCSLILCRGGPLTLSSLCLQHHMDPSSNFCNYRTALQGATQRSQTANSSREKIVIPVFNLFVKDIYFLHKIHTNHLPNGHINFKVSPTP